MSHQRITLWGNSGSGKSTIAEFVGRELQLPVFHLDLIAWEPGWRFRDEAAFLEVQSGWLNQPRWMIEGVGNWAGLVARFHRADLIVQLDTPRALCHERAIRRITEDRISPNRFMAEGCRYGDVVELQTKIIDDFEDHVRQSIESMLSAEFAAKPQLRLDGSEPADELRQKLVARILAG